MNGVIAYIDDMEGQFCRRINQLSRRRWIRRFFSLFSRLGDWSFWAAMALIVLLLQGPSAWPKVLQMILTGGIGVGIYKLLKSRLIRERPYIRHDAIVCGAAPLDQYSFPSGHTLHAVSFTVLLWQFEPLLLPLAAPVAVLIAMSRVILGLHYPSDVVAGALLGAALAIASLAAF